MASPKVAIVTGGAAGMGFAVASKLIQDTGWEVILVDLNEKVGLDAVASLGGSARFVKADVTKYEEQLAAFETAFNLHSRLDFVFANAGIAGKADFYDITDLWPPKAPSLIVEDVCLRGIIYSCHLGMHFMRRNKIIRGGVIVTTASGMSLIYYHHILKHNPPCLANFY